MFKQLGTNVVLVARKPRKQDAFYFIQHFCRKSVWLDNLDNLTLVKLIGTLCVFTMSLNRKEQ